MGRGHCQSTASQVQVAPRGLRDHVVRDGTEGIEQLCLQPGLQDQQIHMDLREQRGDSSPASDTGDPPPPEGPD